MRGSEAYELPELPEAYIVNTERGQQQIKTPVYLLLADGFYDEVLWPAGEILETSMQPNQNMQPLNRAAGQKLADYLASLPGDVTEALDPGDLLEAAHALRPREGEKELTGEMWIRACRDYALRLKAARDGRKRGAQIPHDHSRRAPGLNARPLGRNGNYADRRAESMNPATEEQIRAHPKPQTQSRGNKPVVTNQPQPSAPGR